MSVAINRIKIEYAIQQNSKIECGLIEFFSLKNGSRGRPPKSVRSELSRFQQGNASQVFCQL
jgi:hypothetical protein